MKILIADAMSDRAVDILKSNHLDVDVKTDLKKEELQAIIGEYDALIVRSATKVTRDIIEKADRLKVIGRAGIGVDNVDVEAATEKGIVVMNTPQGNALAAAEHALALMFALARKVALADRTMKQGKWEKKLLMGVEVYEKTLGRHRHRKHRHDRRRKGCRPGNEGYCLRPLRIAGHCRRKGHRAR